MQCFEDSQGDQVFSVTIGENQEVARPLADTIRWWERWFPSGGMAKW